MQAVSTGARSRQAQTVCLRIFEHYAGFTSTAVRARSCRAVDVGGSLDLVPSLEPQRGDEVLVQLHPHAWHESMPMPSIHPDSPIATFLALAAYRCGYPANRVNVPTKGAQRARSRGRRM